MPRADVPLGGEARSVAGPADRVGRPLHDEVGQIATAVSIQLQRARLLDDEGSKDELIDASLEGTGELLEAMHRISSSLRSSVLDDMGLETALRAHLEPLSEKGGVDIVLDLRASDREVPNPVGVHAFRIVQEAVTNVLRHASAHTVRIETWVEDAVLHLIVDDDGSGFDLDETRAADRQRLGIVGMRERTELFGGGLDLRSEESGGTTLHAWIPLSRTESPTPSTDTLEDMETRSA